MKHIAYLIPTLDRIGGAEQQVLLLATGLAKRSWRVSVIALAGTGGSVAQRLESEGIALQSLGMRKGLLDPRGWSRNYAWIRQNRPDIVHAHLPHASLLARWLRLVAPVRVLVDTIHSPATGGLLRRLGYRMSAGLPDVVTAVSRAAADPWLNSGMVNRETMAVIPNGVDVDRWKRNDEIRNAMRHQLRLKNEFLWLAVGRLDPVKDHTTLLRAFAMLSVEARLVIAGAGPLQRQLRSLAQELDLRDRVQFLGFQTDVLPWMSAADAFVLCSRWEGLPMALIEAGSCELPSVITDIQGAREVLPHSPAALTVAPGDANALAAAMNAAMKIPDLERREFGRRTRKSICERFRLDAVLDHWEDLYGALLEKNPQPSRFGKAEFPPGKTLQLQ